MKMDVLPSGARVRAGNSETREVPFAVHTSVLAADLTFPSWWERRGDWSGSQQRCGRGTRHVVTAQQIRKRRAQLEEGWDGLVTGPQGPEGPRESLAGAAVGKGAGLGG